MTASSFRAFKWRSMSAAILILLQRSHYRKICTHTHTHTIDAFMHIRRIPHTHCACNAGGRNSRRWLEPASRGRRKETALAETALSAGRSCGVRLAALADSSCASNTRRRKAREPHSTSFSYPLRSFPVLSLAHAL